MTKKIKHGDFTGLASSYSKHRPDYSSSVLNCLICLQEKKLSEIKLADVGAGTGVWTRMVYKKGIKNIIAVEPNNDMRSYGKADSSGLNIEWLLGSAEKTNLKSESVNWITMASSFHWADFDNALKEFHRVLMPNGFFTALWNPRLIESNQIFVDIENYLKFLKPNLKRVSSGRSGITKDLTNLFDNSKLFEDVIYIEGRHSIKMSIERYLGIWESVNDLKFQLGKENFDKFLNYVREKLLKLKYIEATYLTRSWTVKVNKT